MVGAPGTSNDRSFTYWTFTTNGGGAGAAAGWGAGVVSDMPLSVTSGARAPWGSRPVACQRPPRHHEWMDPRRFLARGGARSWLSDTSTSGDLAKRARRTAQAPDRRDHTGSSPRC